MHEITVRPDGIAEAAFALKPAWHGLGTVLDHAMTADELLTAAHLDWKVQKRRIAYEVVTESGTEFKPDNHYAAIVREDNQYLLGISTMNRYKIVQNEEIVKMLKTVADERDLKFESAISLRGGKKVILLARMPGVDFVTDTDVLHRFLLVSLGHDGMTGIYVFPTSVRVVCMNTYRLALGTAGTVIRIAHLGDIGSKLEMVVRKIVWAENKIEQHVKEARQLVKTKLTDEKFYEFLDQLIPDKKARKAVQLRKQIEFNYLENPRQNMPDIAKTAWAAFCAVTETVDHAERRGKTLQAKALTRFTTSIFTTGHTIKTRALTLLNEYASAG